MKKSVPGYTSTRSSARRPGRNRYPPPVYILKPRIIKICIANAAGWYAVDTRNAISSPPNALDPQHPPQSLLGGGTPNPNFSLKFHPFFGNVPSIGVVGAEASPPPFFPPNGATSVGRPTPPMSAHNQPPTKREKKTHEYSPSLQSHTPSTADPSPSSPASPPPSHPPLSRPFPTPRPAHPAAQTQ